MLKRPSSEQLNAYHYTQKPQHIIWPHMSHSIPIKIKLLNNGITVQLIHHFRRTTFIEPHGTSYAKCKLYLIRFQTKLRKLIDIDSKILANIHRHMHAHTNDVVPRQRYVSIITHSQMIALSLSIHYYYYLHDRIFR